MNEVVTINDLIHLGLIIVGLWGFIKVIMEIVKKITERHDREQKWDEMAESINESRQSIIQKYDYKLVELEKKIDDNHADTEAKLQQLGADMFMHTMVLNAVLDGLTQLGANGNVTKAKHDLDEYITRQAYDMK